jgi:hypothetical protein
MAESVEYMADSHRIKTYVGKLDQEYADVLILE